jgi:hypothetical protein
LSAPRRYPEALLYGFSHSVREAEALTLPPLTWGGLIRRRVGPQKLDE